MPIPLSGSRLLRRGFNQSEALAKVIGKQLNLALKTNYLRRIRDTNSQQGLKRSQRLKNLKGCFKVEGIIEGKAIALFDDVITTGATMDSAAYELKQQGAKKVLA